MKMLWKLTKEAARYKGLYILAIVSTLCLTAVNLAAPKGTVNHDRHSGKEAGKYVLLHNYEADADFAGTLSAADSFPVFKQLSGA